MDLYVVFYRSFSVWWIYLKYRGTNEVDKICMYVCMYICRVGTIIIGFAVCDQSTMNIMINTGLRHQTKVLS